MKSTGCYCLICGQRIVGWTGVPTRLFGRFVHKECNDEIKAKYIGVTG